MRSDRVRTILFGTVLAVQATLVALNLVFPGWTLVDLDEEHNLPTYFQTALLGLAAILALNVTWRESLALQRSGGPRGLAFASGVGVAVLLAGMALDESLVLHERFNTQALQAGLGATSPLQGMVVWLLLLAPAIVAALGFLIVWIDGRRRVHPTIRLWGAAALGCWVAALVLEGTAKSVFIPRGLYWLEVVLEESAEALAPTLFLCGLWEYRARLLEWLEVAGSLPASVHAVRWPRVAVVGTAVLVVPIILIGGAIRLNPAVRLKKTADEHLRLGRLAEAAHTYHAVLATFPRWARAWDRLGVTEYRRGDLAAAEAAFGRAGRLDPRDATVLTHLGAVLFRRARYDEAVGAFSRAGELAPHDPDVHRNLAITFRRLGRDFEADVARRRADALGPPGLEVAEYAVRVEADVALTYVRDPRLEAAMQQARAGRIPAAIAAYRRALSSAPGVAAAHLGLANELTRWRIVTRMAGALVPRASAAEEPPEARTAIAFTDWVRGTDHRWVAVSVTVETAGSEAAAGLGGEAAAHYVRALALGAGAPAHLGLAILAREDARAEEALRQFATAEAADPALPGLALVRAALAPSSPAAR